MRNHHGRLASLLRTAAVIAVALGLATPAAAQFGGLKKKAKQAAEQEGAKKAGEAATEQAPEAAQAANAGARAADAGAPAEGGTVVLTEDVVKQMLAGYNAAQAEREAAKKENTPYGQYLKAQAAYADAKPKCDEATTSWPQRALADEKMAKKYTATVDKMMKAQQDGDMKLYAAYGDSAMGIMSPSCLVKQPTQPDNYYEMQRDIDARAEKAEMKGSGLSRSELAMAKEKAFAILQNAAGPEISNSEKNVVNTHGAELKRVVGLEQAPPARATKPAPAPAPAPAPTATAPTVSPGQQSMNDCMVKNVQAHEKEIRELGERAQAAANAGDTPKAIAISDTLRQLQMAGCTGDK
jgi:hypothetical protein